MARGGSARTLRQNQRSPARVSFHFLAEHYLKADFGADAVRPEIGEYHRSFTPPTETSLTHYDRVNYIIAKGEHALYMLSCTQHWKPTKKNRALGVLIAGTVGTGEASDKLAQASGTWTECPSFAIGVTYVLSVQNTSDARLVGANAAKFGDLACFGRPTNTIVSAATRQLYRRDESSHHIFTNRGRNLH